MIQKAFVLTAGLGERLKPLTLKTPKPMLPIGGKPLIDYVLRYLKKEGVQEVILNLFHLGDQIERYVGMGDKFGLVVHYSREQTLLGTGGGLRQAAQWLEREKEFIVINGDTLIGASLKELYASHQTLGAAATLVLKKKNPDESYTPISCEDSKITAIGEPHGDYFYTGLMIATPKLIKKLPTGPSCLIRQGIIPLLRNGATIGGHLFDGFWCDIGTPERYQQIQEEWASNHLNNHL